MAKNVYCKNWFMSRWFIFNLFVDDALQSMILLCSFYPGDLKASVATSHGKFLENIFILECGVSSA